MWALGHALTAPLLISLPGSSVCAPATHVKDQEEAPGFSLSQPHSLWPFERNADTGSLSLPFSFHTSVFQIN